MHRVPGHIELRGHAGTAAHHFLSGSARAHARQQRLPVGPHRLHGHRTPVGTHLSIDPVGRAAQRQLAQGQQVSFAKKIGGGAFGLLRHIDLAGLEAPQQFVGRQVDHHHLVGFVENAVGHGFPDADTGDAAHHVVEALKVLDVHGRPDIDTGGQQFLCVLPALGVARTGGVAVGQLVQQNEGAGLAAVHNAKLQGPFQIEFRQRTPIVRDLAWRKPHKARGHGFGVAAAMGFNHAYQQGRSMRLCGLGCRQHGVGLAHTGIGTEENLEPPTPRPHLVALHLLKQSVGIGAGVAHRQLL